jgi:tetratricopeptide (TPR) repeat protein
MRSRLTPSTPTLFVAVSLTLLLAGCHQMGTVLGLSDNKVAAARKAPLSASPDAPGDVTESQKADVQIAVARSLENHGQNDQAIKAYQEALKQDKNRADACQRIAVLYDKKGDETNARKYYAMALEKAPKNAELLTDMGYSCYLHRRWEESEKHLRKALVIDPQLARAHNNLGLLLARNGRTDEALREFASAGCSEAEAHANLGFALSMGDDLKKAQQHYMLAQRLDPKSPTTRRGMEVLQAFSAPRPTPPQAPRVETPVELTPQQVTSATVGAEPLRQPIQGAYTPWPPAQPGIGALPQPAVAPSALPSMPPPALIDNATLAPQVTLDTAPPFAPAAPSAMCSTQP